MIDSKQLNKLLAVESQAVQAYVNLIQQVDDTEILHRLHLCQASHQDRLLALRSKIHALNFHCDDCEKDPLFAYDSIADVEENSSKYIKFLKKSEAQCSKLYSQVLSTCRDEPLRDYIEKQLATRQDRSLETISTM